MAQLHFTLESDFFTGLFSESKDEAFGKLMEALLNQVLLAESKEQLGAENYERSSSRTDYRNGFRTRPLTTRVGKIELKLPRHRNVPFKTSLFEEYQRNEQALICTMMEMVVQGVSTRNVRKVTEELCGESFSKSTVSEICKELDIPVKQFKERLLPDKYPFVIADAMYLKVREDHRVRSKALYIAIGVNTSGHKEVLGFEAYDSEKTSSWKEFFESLKSRGLRDVDIVISDAHTGLLEAIRECFPGSSWQRCQAHFTRNIIDKCPKRYQTGLASELKDMFNASTIKESRALKESIYDEYIDVAPEAMSLLDSGFEDSMSIMALPSKYRTAIRTSNIIERENRELRRRERVIQIFPNKESMIRLMGAVLMDDHNDWSAAQRLFDMTEYFDNLPQIKILLRRAA
ncbi:MAG: IS256 family transposase [Butyrivibrio hungatei]|nr:IS256 family transposase [Butyrivibrio hungatei]